MGLFTRQDSRTKISSKLAEIEDNGKIVFDKYGKIRYVNKAAAKMTGYNNTEAMLGGNLFDIVILKDHNNVVASSVQNQVINAANTIKPYTSRNCSIVSAKGEVSLPIELTLIPFLFEDEQLFLLKLENIIKDLERERSQSEFIATASHEMRTPVAAIQGYIDLALNPRLCQIDAKTRSVLEKAKEASVRLGDLFTNLLDTSRLEDGRTIPKMEKIGINAFIQKFESDFRILTSAKHQQLELQLSPTEIFCNLDFTFLQDILSNLVENATKYTQEGGKIIIHTQADNSVAQISVKDNGTGISESDLTHIFNKFFRSANTNLQTGGTGLGLYLVKQRTEMMGGKIEVKSEVGKGSIFTVIFPMITNNLTTQNKKNANQDLVAKEIKPITSEELQAADPLTPYAKDRPKIPFTVEEMFSRPLVKLAEKWRNGEIPATSDEDKKIIYDAMREDNKSVPIEQFNKVWKQFEPRLDNPGLSEMLKKMTRTRNDLSFEFNVPWMLGAPSAASWEAGYGLGYDFEGRWREFPQNSKAWAYREPIFSWVRERAILARKEIANKDSVLFLFAGVLPELRNISYYPMPKEVWACDEDTNLDTKNIFGWSTAEHNVHYDIMRISDYIDKAVAQGKTFDVIVMNGASLSHYDEFDSILENAMRILKPGGTMMFDIQLEHWDLIRAWFVFGISYNYVTSVPSLTDLDRTVAKITDMCKQLPDVKLEYAVDSRNKPPTAVMFYIKK